MSRAKRAMDVIGAGIGIVLLCPLMIVVGLLIVLEDGGSMLFRQERVGLHGRIFRMWKLRTMVVDAEQRGRQLTVGRDPRITRVGYWLRRTKLDEVPQLINVLRGDMSLVGPRPEVPRYVRLYDDAQRRVLSLHPGITDPASIRFRDEASILGKSADPERTYVERLMPEKIRLNLAYADRASRWNDVQVIFATFAAPLRHRFASARGETSMLSPALERDVKA
jgi:lipopolysaccharide/colanic/teichoic acid biosynthesis glycosyltransferase